MPQNERAGKTGSSCRCAGTFPARPARRGSRPLTAQSAPTAAGTAPGAASAPPRRCLHPPTLGFTSPYPELGSQFTGPRPSLPEFSHWFLQMPVVQGRCRLAGEGGDGRASESVGRAGTRMCVVAAAEELV